MTLPCTSENEGGSKDGAEIGNWWKACLESTQVLSPLPRPQPDKPLLPAAEAWLPLLEDELGA